jgi:hypothetical protein
MTYPQNNEMTDQQRDGGRRRSGRGSDGEAEAVASLLENYKTVSAEIYV